MSQSEVDELSRSNTNENDKKINHSRTSTDTTLQSVIIGREDSIGSSRNAKSESNWRGIGKKKSMDESIGHFTQAVKQTLEKFTPYKTNLISANKGPSIYFDDILSSHTNSTQTSNLNFIDKSTSMEFRHNSSYENITHIINFLENDRKGIEFEFEFDAFFTANQILNSTDLNDSDFSGMTPYAVDTPTIKAAVLSKLIERLTWFRLPDQGFIYAFLRTFESFTTKDELLNLLIERYDYKVPEELIRNEDERKSVMEHIIFPIRVRVSNVIKYWLTRYPDSLLPLELVVIKQRKFRSYSDAKERNDASQLRRSNSYTKSRASTDFDDTTEEEPAFKSAPGSTETFVFLNRLKDWIDNTMSINLDKAADNLSRLIQKMLNSPSWMQYGVIKSTCATKKTTPAVLFSRKQLNSIDIAQVDPLEIARQMCLIDERIFRSIRTRELLGQKWTLENKTENSPNVVAMITSFNNTVDIFSSHIISKKTARGRSNLIRHFINVGKKLLYLGNFNSCHAIVSAMSSAAIYRLRKSWDFVPRQIQADLQGLKNIFSPNDNYALLRNQLRNVEAPGVPWIGLYLRDLIIVDEAQKFVTHNRSQQRKHTKLNMPLQASGSSEISNHNSMILFSDEDTLPELDGEGVLPIVNVDDANEPERVSNLNFKSLVAPDPPLIQFSKYRTMARTLDELFKLRAQTYHFEPLPAIQSILIEDGIIYSPSVQFRMSIALEPLNTPSSDHLEEELEYFSSGEDLDTKSNKSGDDIKQLFLPTVEAISSEGDFEKVFIGINEDKI